MLLSLLPLRSFLLLATGLRLRLLLRLRGVRLHSILALLRMGRKRGFGPSQARQEPQVWLFSGGSRGKALLPLRSFLLLATGLRLRLLLRLRGVRLRSTVASVKASQEAAQAEMGLCLEQHAVECTQPQESQSATPG